jgi:hypothetical protein
MWCRRCQVTPYCSRLYIRQCGRSENPGYAFVGEQRAAAEQGQPLVDVGVPEAVEHFRETAGQAADAVGLCNAADQRDLVTVLLVTRVRAERLVPRPAVAGGLGQLKASPGNRRACR